MGHLWRGVLVFPPVGCGIDTAFGGRIRGGKELDGVGGEWAEQGRRMCSEIEQDHKKVYL